MSTGAISDTRVSSKLMTTWRPSPKSSSETQVRSTSAVDLRGKERQRALTSERASTWRHHGSVIAMTESWATSTPISMANGSSVSAETETAPSITHVASIAARTLTTPIAPNTAAVVPTTASVQAMKARAREAGAVPSWTDPPSDSEGMGAWRPSRHSKSIMPLSPYDSLR